MEDGQQMKEQGRGDVSNRTYEIRVKRITQQGLPRKDLMKEEMAVQVQSRKCSQVAWTRYLTEK